jgi:hypothetical protein
LVEQIELHCGTGVGLGVIVGTGLGDGLGLGDGVGVAQIQLASLKQAVFLQKPAEQVIPLGQSGVVVHVELHWGTGDGLGDGVGVAISKVSEQLDGSIVAAAGLLDGALGVIVPVLV